MALSFYIIAFSNICLLYFVGRINEIKNVLKSFPIDFGQMSFLRFLGGSQYCRKIVLTFLYGDVISEVCIIDRFLDRQRSIKSLVKAKQTLLDTVCLHVT